ncbi:outer membrane lipoprotein-sorting protein [Dyadobacter psychrotolerans]|uniref:Outer membrane lipoprotein-sorting protein n=1 Tax=Dyadobacter psychrotolerans TaxID=2541721 RepID=A0A4R5DWM7_9BACT|nr:outer membrane lipoprotein-sorting protein [Dyadobacter psychrotolerans]TDE16820.1 outer membrane lipoprotein-sorting protein [Dyadobacter psychrotolerans]
MYNYKGFKLLVILFITGIAQTVSAQSVDEIIAKHITAMGGADKLSKLKSVAIVSNMEVMNMEMPVKITIVQDKGFRTETTVQGMTIIQATDGVKGWMVNPMAGDGKPVELPQEAVQQYASQTDLTGLYNYKQKGLQLALEGEQELNGAKVYKIVATLKSGAKQDNYISKDTYYVLKVVATVSANGQNITTENIQSDFKQVDGVTFPFSSELTTSAMPGAKVINKIESVAVNAKVDESIFAMPK